MTPAFRDAHNHLQDRRFDGSRDEIVAAMRDVGIDRCVVNGTCESDWPVVARLAERFPDFVMPAFGLHPWQAAACSPDWLDRLAGWLDRFPHASIGECGVDRWVRSPAIGIQREVFVAQLKLAIERSLPLSIHCLKAWGALLECLALLPPLPRGFLLHSFGGSSELVRQLVPHGAWFSASGSFLEPRKAAVIEALRIVPADRLLLETDAPDMLPPESHVTHPLRAADGTVLNHPANLPRIGAGFAALFSIPPDELARQSHANFARFFGHCSVAQ